MAVSVFVLFAVYANIVFRGFGSYDARWALLSLLVFVVIPLGIPVLWYVTKRKFLWASPIAAFALSVIAIVIIEPSTFGSFQLVFFSDYQDGSTTRAVMTLLCIPMLISICGTTICQAVKTLKVRR